MMGRKERAFAPLTHMSLEELVPQDHFYRYLEQKLDLSFVRTFVQETYASLGRPSIDPIVFFKLQLVMFFESIRSERQLVRQAADRLSIRWYLGVRHVTHCSIPSETERTRRRFFGSRAYLAPKGNGDNSMLLKQEAAKAL
jgi:transposase